MQFNLLFDVWNGGNKRWKCFGYAISLMGKFLHIDYGIIFLQGKKGNSEVNGCVYREQ